MAHLYDQKVMDHYRYPAHKGKPKSYTEKMDGQNPFCGDRITLYLSVNRQGMISDVSWEGAGCVISQAAASIFAEHILGKKFTEAQKITSEWMLEHLDLTLSPTRVKCALLPLYTLKGITDATEPDGQTG